MVMMMVTTKFQRIKYVHNISCISVTSEYCNAIMMCPLIKSFKFMFYSFGNNNVMLTLS